MHVLYQLDRIALDLETTHPADIPFQDYREELRHLFHELLELEQRAKDDGTADGCVETWARLVTSARAGLERAGFVGADGDVDERRAVLKQATMELHFIADFLTASELAG
jgi:hypothetical protein